MTEHQYRLNPQDSLQIYSATGNGKIWILSEVTGRKFGHTSLTEEELFRRFTEKGVPKGFAKPLAMMDTMVANGGKGRLNDVVEKMTGHPLKTFRVYAEKNRDKFM